MENVHFVCLVKREQKEHLVEMVKMDFLGTEDPQEEEVC